MGYYSSIEESNKAAETRIKGYREAAAMVPAVIEVIKKFDGKVYNCRFDKAIHELDSRIHAWKHYNCLSVYMHPYPGCYNEVTLSSISLDEMPNKRIPADKMILDARERRESLLKKAYEIESMMSAMPQVKAYIDETKRKLEAYLKQFPTDVRELYGLPCYVALG